MTWESKGFCETPSLVLQALVKDQTGLSRGSPGEEAGPSLALKLLSASSLLASPSLLDLERLPLRAAAVLYYLFCGGPGSRLARARQCASASLSLGQDQAGGR